ncbi:hypothetical protein EDC01DRAFT_631647 [Geopyxis carbonaria]|nr:hypothetical protein EDC01DRAFT_631647 [Geopyxis carbonaria]
MARIPAESIPNQNDDTPLYTSISLIENAIEKLKYQPGNYTDVVELLILRSKEDPELLELITRISNGKGTQKCCRELEEEIWDCEEEISADHSGSDSGSECGISDSIPFSGDKWANKFQSEEYIKEQFRIEEEIKKNHRKSDNQGELGSSFNQSSGEIMQPMKENPNLNEYQERLKLIGIDLDKFHESIGSNYTGSGTTSSGLGDIEYLQQLRDHLEQENREVLQAMEESRRQHEKAQERIFSGYSFESATNCEDESHSLPKLISSLGILGTSPVPSQNEEGLEITRRPTKRKSEDGYFSSTNGSVPKRTRRRASSLPGRDAIFKTEPTNGRSKSCPPMDVVDHRRQVHEAMLEFKEIKTRLQKGQDISQYPMAKLLGFDVTPPSFSDTLSLIKIPSLAKTVRNKKGEYWIEKALAQKQLFIKSRHSVAYIMNNSINKAEKRICQLAVEKLLAYVESTDVNDKAEAEAVLNDFLAKDGNAVRDFTITGLAKKLRPIFERVLRNQSSERSKDSTEAPVPNGKPPYESPWEVVDEPADMELAGYTGHTESIDMPDAEVNPIGSPDFEMLDLPDHEFQDSPSNSSKRPQDSTEALVPDSTFAYESPWEVVDFLPTDSALPDATEHAESMNGSGEEVYQSPDFEMLDIPELILDYSLSPSPP